MITGMPWTGGVVHDVPFLVTLYYDEKTPTLDGYERDFLRKLGFRFDEVWGASNDAMPRALLL